MSEINKAAVMRLRDASGCGMMEAKKALEACGGDVLLAEGYLKYQGCAVRIREAGYTDEEAYQRWVWRNARSYAKKEATP